VRDMKGGFGCSPCCGTPCVYQGRQTEQFTASGWVAQSFVTPAGGLTLHSVTLLLDFNTNLIASDYVLELYSDNNGYPDSNSEPDAHLLTLTTASSLGEQTLNIGGFGSGTYKTISFTAPGEPLTGSTRYWVVAKMVEDYYIPGNWWYFLYDSATCPSAPRALGEAVGWYAIEPFVQQLLIIN
jgi:hypothetical protein